MNAGAGPETTPSTEDTPQDTPEDTTSTKPPEDSPTGIDPPADWEPSPAHIASANAIRRLTHAVMERIAPDSDFRACTNQIENLAAQLELHPARQRNRPRFIDQMSGTGDDTRWSNAFVDSPFCGDINAVAPPMTITRDGRQAVGRVTCPRPYQGAPARVHGGVVAGLVDDVMGSVLGIEKVLAFTGELTVRYESGCPTDMPLEFRAWTTGQAGRKIFMTCEGHSELGLFVTGTATFITIDEMAVPTGVARRLRDNP